MVEVVALSALGSVQLLVLFILIVYYLVEPLDSTSSLVGLDNAELLFYVVVLWALTEHLLQVLVIVIYLLELIQDIHLVNFTESVVEVYFISLWLWATIVELILLILHLLELTVKVLLDLRILIAVVIIFVDFDFQIPLGCWQSSGWNRPVTQIFFDLLSAFLKQFLSDTLPERIFFVLFCVVEVLGECIKIDLIVVVVDTKKVNLSWWFWNALLFLLHLRWGWL